MGALGQGDLKSKGGLSVGTPIVACDGGRRMRQALLHFSALAKRLAWTAKCNCHKANGNTVHVACNEQLRTCSALWCLPRLLKDVAWAALSCESSAPRSPTIMYYNVVTAFSCENSASLPNGFLLREQRVTHFGLTAFSCENSASLINSHNTLF